MYACPHYKNRELNRYLQLFVLQKTYNLIGKWSRKDDQKRHTRLRVFLSNQRPLEIHLLMFVTAVACKGINFERVFRFR